VGKMVFFGEVGWDSDVYTRFRLVGCGFRLLGEEE